MKILLSSDLYLRLLVLCVPGLHGSPAILPRPHIVHSGIALLDHHFSLTCVVILRPGEMGDPLTFTWYKDDDPLRGQSNAQLAFPRVVSSDAGKYKCRVTGSHVLTTSVESTPFQLIVLMSPTVTIEPAQRPVIKAVLGKSLTLTCVVTDALPRVPSDGYSWSYVPCGSEPSRALSEKGNTLTLGPMTRKDSGQYTCQAWNNEGFEGLIPPGRVDVNVTVSYLESITLTSDLEVDEGQHVTLTCSVESSPPARLVWVVEGQEVRHVTANVDNYVIEKAASSDSKTYTCRATNPELPDVARESCTQLRVRRDAEADHPTTPLAIFGVAQPGVDVTASFRIAMPDVTTVVVILHPTGREFLKWRSPCSCDVRHEFSDRVRDISCDARQREVTFKLTSLTSKDEGEYSCHVGNQGQIIPNCGSTLLKFRERNLESGDAMHLLTLVVGVAVGVVVGASLAMYRYTRGSFVNCRKKEKPPPRNEDVERSAACEENEEISKPLNLESMA